MAGDCQRLAVLRVQRDGAVGEAAGFDHRRLWVRRPALADQEHQPVGEPRMCRRVVRFLRNGVAQQFAGLHERLPVQAADQRDGAQHQIVAGGIERRALGDALRFDEQDFRVDLGDDLGGDFVLHGQQVVHFPIEAAGPDDLVADAQIQQAQRDAQA